MFKLDEVLLGDVAGAEVSDPIHRHNPNVLNGTQQVLKEEGCFIERQNVYIRTYFEGDEISPHFMETNDM